MPRPRQDGKDPAPTNRRILTHLMIKGLKPRPDARYLVWDARGQNLALAVYPTGAKVWLFIYSRKPRKRWHKIGRLERVGLSEAREEATRLANEVFQGRDPKAAAEAAAAKNADTFAAVYDRYLEEWAKVRNKSWPQADYLIKKHVLPRWGKTNIADIARRDARELHSYLSRDRLVLADSVLAAASVVFTWGMKQEVVEANPCRLIDKNPKNERDRVLSDSELPLVWEAFDSVGPVVAAALKTILLTGQRGGEVLRMRREHIRDGFWEMPGKKVLDLGWLGTKNKNPHRVYLSTKVRDLIGDGATGRVFARAGRLDAAMRKISSDLQLVPPVTPHDLRRSFATRVAELGYSEEAVDRLSNHKRKRMRRVYIRHNYATQDKEIMERVAERIINLAERRDNVVTAVFGGRAS
jgi:integrase